MFSMHVHVSTGMVAQCCSPGPPNCSHFWCQGLVSFRLSVFLWRYLDVDDL